MATEKVVKLVEEVKELTVLELSELVKALEEEFGVSAAAPVAMMAGPAATAEAAVEEQTEFDVVMTSFGAEKIKVIKVVRELTGLGLKEAKEAVEGVPTKIKEALPKEEAEKTVAKLKEVGADVVME